VANINLKEPIKFEINAAPDEENVGGDVQKTTVIIPHDPKI
jgi:hypothetical protein